MIKHTSIAAALMTFTASCSTIKTEHHITLDHKITIDMNIPVIDLNLKHTHTFLDNNLTYEQKKLAMIHSERLAEKQYEKIKD
jgi:hypothetical protein